MPSADTSRSKSHSVTANVSKMSGVAYCGEPIAEGGGGDIFFSAKVPAGLDLHCGDGGTQSRLGMRAASGWA